MPHVRARAPFTAVAVLALVLATAAGASAGTLPAKANPKDLAIAKASLLQQTDVPGGFTQVPAKITKPKPSGIKACKPNEAINKVTQNKAKSAFDATDESSIESTVDVFKNAATMTKAIKVIDSPLTIACLKQTFAKQLAKNKNITSTVSIVQQPVTLGDTSTSFVATITASAGGQSKTITSFAGFVGVGRAATQVIYTDESGAFDPTVAQGLLQAADTNLQRAQLTTS